MIRFSCPGCAATYSVDDAKAGKTGKCPKCQSQFVIPASVSPAADAPPPLPTPSAPDPGAAVEIAPCPGCQARLSVAASDIGVNVECPYCKTVYAAARPDGAATASKPMRAPVSKPAGDDFAFTDDDRPSRKRRDDYDDEPRSSRKRRDDDYDDEPRPKKKRKKSRYDDVESKRITAGILALLLGAYGVHKFYLGYSGAGVIQLLITFVTCGIAGIIPFVEGIMYLTKTDEDFIETYQIGQKEWF
jgi:TM2 domain-containing membrane protein YozV